MGMKITVVQDVKSWYMIMNVSKEPASTIFYPEDGWTKFLWNDENGTTNCRASHPRRHLSSTPESLFSLNVLWKIEQIQTWLQCNESTIGMYLKKIHKINFNNNNHENGLF